MIRRHDYIGNDFSDRDVVWKYFSLPSFLALLEDSELFFSCVNSLEDPNEFPITERDAHAFRMSIEDFRATVNRFKSQSFVNCWRISEYESFGMWNSYADSSTGIAIKTDVQALFYSINSKMDDYPNIIAGKVSYFDCLHEMAQTHNAPLNTFFIAFTKTKPYENENEVRLCFEDTRKRFTEDGIGIPVDVVSLIQEVYVGPKSKTYLPELIKKILGHYGIQVPVIRSIVK